MRLPITTLLLLAFLALALALGISGVAGVTLSMYTGLVERACELADEWGLEWLSPLLSGALALGTMFVPLVCIYFAGRRLPALELWVPTSQRALRKNAAGVALYDRRAYQAAVVEFDEALRLNPGLATAYQNRGNAYLLLQRLDEAERDFQATLPLSKHPSAAHVGLANVAYHRGDINRALLECNAALELDPANAWALASRGNIWLLQGDVERALADFERALFYAPRLGLAYRGRAQVRLLQQRWDEALADLQQALAFGGDGIDLALRARVWLERGDYRRALADLNTAIEEGECRAETYRDRALAWIMLGKYEPAIADATEALRLDPNDAIAWNNRGTAHLRSGAYAKALADLQQAQQRDPKLPHPYKNLAWLRATCPQAEFRDGAQAVSLATQALEMAQGKMPEWLEILAAAHAEAGQFEDAVRRQAEYVAAAPAEARALAQERLELYQTKQPFRA